MPHTDPLADAMRNALAKLPGTLNALAKRAGVSQPQLWRIVEGKRNVTPVVAEKIARALEAWADESRDTAKHCAAAAKAIRRAVRTRRDT